MSCQLPTPRAQKPSPPPTPPPKEPSPWHPSVPTLGRNAKPAEVRSTDLDRGGLAHRLGGADQAGPPSHAEPRRTAGRPSRVARPGRGDSDRTGSNEGCGAERRQWGEERPQLKRCGGGQNMGECLGESPGDRSGSGQRGKLMQSAWIWWVKCLQSSTWMEYRRYESMRKAGEGL